LNLQNHSPENQSSMDARAHRLTLINSIIGVTIAGMSTRVFMISVPTLATALGTDILGISWALIVYQMAGIGLGVICGRLGDIYGHRKMFGSGMGIMAVGSLLCGLSQDVFQLILFRFIQGVGGAMIQSSGRTLAFRAMPAGSEGKAQGLMAMSHQFGFFIGPPIGGLIIDLVHWRGIFFLLFVPSLVGMALCFMIGRSVAASASQRQPIDYRGASIFLGLTVLVTLLLDQKIAEVLGRSMQLLLAVIFAGALWSFIAHERRTPSPMIDLSFFSVPAFGYGSVGLLMCCITQGLVTFVAPFYLQEVLKLTPTFMGNYLFGAVASQHGLIAGKRCLDRSHRRPFALDDRCDHPDDGFSHRRESWRHLSLALARCAARAYRDWLGSFQHAFTGGDD
jgi:MFS family permease